MSTHLRLYGSDKTPLGFLPDHNQLTVQVAHNAFGTLSFQYPNNGVDAGLIDTDTAYLAVVEDGVENPDWFVLEDDLDDDADPQGDARMLTVSARGIMAVLEQAVVYPAAHSAGGPVSGLDPAHEFKNATPGTILKTLIDKAKARGCFPDLTYDFTATTDSAGVAWPTQYSVRYAAGLDYYSLLSAMCDNGWVDARTSAFKLQVYVPDTVLGADRPDVLVRLGQQVEGGPKKRSRRGIFSTVLGAGAAKNLVEVSDAGALSRSGRREGFAADGRMTEAGSLSALAKHQLDQHVYAKEGFSLKVALQAPDGEDWPIPGTDYTVGQKIRYDQRRTDDTTFEPLRVRTITWEWGSKTDHPQCTIELNDLFVEAAIQLQRRVDGILNGSSTDAPPPTEPVTDKVAPNAPTGVTIEASIYEDKGHFRDSVLVSWTAPALNVNGTPYDDHSHYEMSWRVNGSAWSPVLKVDDAQAWVNNQLPGATFEARVRAVDGDDNTSVWSASTSEVLPDDTTPPPQPSVPVVSSRLGTVTVVWDGHDKDGAAMPDDLDYLAVHKSTDPGFTHSSATLTDYIYQPGGAVLVTGLAYNVAYSFALVAVDKAGNASVQSAVATITTKPLVNTDLIGQVVAGANLVDSSIDSPKIIAGAVDATRLRIGSANQITDHTFDNADLRAVRVTASKAVTFAQDATIAKDGKWYATLAGRDSTQDARLDLRAAAADATGIPVASGMKYRWAAWLRRTQDLAVLSRVNLSPNPTFDKQGGSTYEAARNLIPNPGFETTNGTVTYRTNLYEDGGFEATTASPNTSAWTVTADTGVSYSGSMSSKFVVADATGGHIMSAYKYNSAGGQAIKATPGEVFSASVMLRPAAAYRTGYAKIIFRDVNGNALTSLSGPTTDLPANTWTMTKVEGAVAPASTDSVYVTWYINTKDGSTPPVGEASWADGLCLERGAYALGFFDGSHSAFGDYTYAWTGAANASTSVITAPGISQWGCAGGSMFGNKGWVGAGTRSGKVVSATVNGATNTVYAYPAAAAGGQFPHAPGDYLQFSVLVHATQAGWVGLNIATYDSNGTYLTQQAIPTRYFHLAAGENRTLVIRGVSQQSSAAAVTCLPHVFFQNADNSAAAQFGASFNLDQGMLVRNGGAPAYFDGGSPSAGIAFTYSWVGTADASESVCTATTVDGWNRQSTIALTCQDVPDAYTGSRVGRITVLQSVADGGLLANGTTTRVPASPGQKWSGRIRVRGTATSPTAGRTAKVYIAAYNASGGFIANVASGVGALPTDGSWTDLTVAYLADTPANTVQVLWMVYAGQAWAAGDELEMDAALIEQAQTPGTYFDGNASSAVAIRPKVNVKTAAGTTYTMAAGTPADMTAVSVDSWTLYEWEWQAPPGAVAASPLLDLISQTAGSLYVAAPDFRPKVGGVLIEDGAVTAAKVAALAIEAGHLAANSVTADAIDVGAVVAEKIGLGILGANLVPDPSFEENYEVEPDLTTNIYHWRLVKGVGAYSATKGSPSRSRSGAKSLCLYNDSSGTSQAWVRSGVFPVVPGKTYTLVTYAASLFSAGNFYARVAGGTTTDLLEWPADSTSNGLPLDTLIEGVHPTLAAGNVITPDSFDEFSSTFTVPDGVTWAAVELMQHLATNSTVVVDDVSVVEYGTGASELTAAGLRLFGPDGREVGAFVNNRPNYLTVISGGDTVAAIDKEGNISGASLQSDQDMLVLARPLVGLQGASLFDYVDFANDPAAYGRDYEQDPIGIIEQYAKGTVAWCQFHGTDFTQTIADGQEMGLFEIGFDMEPGRQYSFSVSPIILTVTGNGTGDVELRLRATLDGSVPSMTSGILSQDCTTAPNGTDYVSVSIPSRLANGSVTSQTQLRLLVCIFAGDGVTSAAVHPNTSATAFIEDLGPIKTATGTIRNYKTGGTTSSTTPSLKTYTKTYVASNHGTYKSNGSKRTDTSDIVQGYNSYNGDGQGLWTFPSMTSDLSGATVKKIEVYAYANHWWYNAGGIGLIKVHGYSSPPASSPSMTTACTTGSTSNPWRVGGRWVTLPSSLYAGFKSGSYKGFGMGPAGTTNQWYYGRFNGSGAEIRVTYQK